MKLEDCRQIFEKYSNVKCNENSFTGSHADRQTEYRQSDDVKKLIVAFRNFASTPNNIILVLFLIILKFLLNYSYTDW